MKQNIEAVIRDAREFLSQKVGGTAGSDGVEIIQLAIKQTFLSLDPRLSTLKCSDLGQDTEWIKMLHDGAIRLGYEELIDEDCLLALALARLNKNLGCHSLPRFAYSCEPPPFLFQKLMFIDQTPLLRYI